MNDYLVTFTPDGSPELLLTVRTASAREAVRKAQANHGGMAVQYEAWNTAYTAGLLHAQLQHAIAPSARDRAFWRRALDVMRRAAAR